MKYSRFELLVLAVGSVAIVGAVLVTLNREPLIEEIIGQALLLFVLVGAVHWGRRGGWITTLLATLAYLLMRAPLLVRDGLSPDVAALILTRTLTYAFVGVAGGELCSRIRYFLARLDDATNIDESTQLFNQRFIIRMLRSELGHYERYGRPFSVVIVSLGKSVTADLRPGKQRSVLRGVATHIRNDLRLVDDAGCLDDGRFLLVLPDTNKAGAQVAAHRVSGGVRSLLGIKDESASAIVLSVAEDLDAIRKLCGAATGEAEGERATKACA